MRGHRPAAASRGPRLPGQRREASISEQTLERLQLTLTVHHEQAQKDPKTGKLNAIRSFIASEFYLLAISLFKPSTVTVPS